MKDLIVYLLCWRRFFKLGAAYDQEDVIVSAGERT